MEDIQSSISRASKRLQLTQSFYGLFLNMLNKRWNDEISTACVSKNSYALGFQLNINPVFWNSLSDDEQIGVLQHECMHICLMHLFMWDDFSDKEIGNIAADIEINQNIKKGLLPADTMSVNEFKEKYGPIRESIIKECTEVGMSKPKIMEQLVNHIPTRGVFLEDFPELNMEPNKGARYYYSKLIKAKEDGDCPNLNDLLSQGGPTSFEHDLWSQLQELDEGSKKMLQAQLEHELKEVADSITKSRGTIPGEMQGLIKALLHTDPPKFDWKGYLRRFLGNSIDYHRKSSRRKLNKRFNMNPGRKVKRKKHILVGVDTSGSVSDNELKEFFHEINHIYKAGTKVTVVHCDTTIQKIEEYKPGMEFKVYGRGGTYFEPVLDYYNEHSSEYTCLVYVTDGEANVPPRPKGRMLWVLSSQSNMNEELKQTGQVIKLN